MSPAPSPGTGIGQMLVSVEWMSDSNCRIAGAPSTPGNVCTVGPKYGGRTMARVREEALGDLGQIFDLPASPREVGRQGEGGYPLP